LDGKSPLEKVKIEIERKDKWLTRLCTI